MIFSFGGVYRICYLIAYLGRRTAIARGNGTSSAFSYDYADRPTSLTQNLASTASDLTLGWSYSPASQVLTRAVSNDAYDWTNRPAANDNYTFDGLNRDAAIAAVTGGYDGRGNLTFDGTRTYGYDLENRLVSVSGSPATSLAYDPLGRLKTITAGAAATGMLYDGDRLSAEYNGSTLLRRYVHGPGVDEALVWYEGSGTTDRRWLHADNQGSVIAWSNGSGASGGVYAYGPYGEPQGWTGSRFRYTGQIVLPEAQLYHYKARAYDPMRGWFLQTDPIGYEDDYNLYAYVAGDPVNNVDPDGKALETIWDAANLAIGATSFANNVKDGNVGGAIVDGIGLVIDGAAVAIPFVPGGAGATIQAVRLGDKAADTARASVKINPQKQAGHIPGTPQNGNRVRQGKPTSSFFGARSGDKLTRDTAATGKAVQGRPGVKEKDYGVSVGTGPNGGSQTKVRTHQDQDGKVHGHPSGPEKLK